jgi:hypothetical protein
LPVGETTTEGCFFFRSGSRPWQHDSGVPLGFRG